MNDFERIYYEYHDAVYRYVFSLCRDSTQAEEITQESFFRALKHIDSFRGDCSLRTWLCQIAKNTFCSDARRLSRVADVPLESIPSDENVEQTVFRRDTVSEIMSILRQMEEPYRSVFLLHADEGLSFRSISAAFGKSESWARVTYYRAKMKIKEKMK